MMKPDWTKAPEEATHWDTKNELFCDATRWWTSEGVYFRVIPWTDRYIPRPVDSKDKTEELR